MDKIVFRVTWVGKGFKYIEAKSLDEAVKIANSMNKNWQEIIINNFKAETFEPKIKSK